jgi:hypothetical protein
MTGQYNIAGLYKTDIITSVTQEAAFQLHCDEGHTGKLHSCSVRQSASTFTEPADFRFSQRGAIRPYPEPEELSLHPHAIFLENEF